MIGLASITKGRVLEPLRQTCLGSCSLPSLAGKEFQNFYSKVLLLILSRLLLQMLGMESVLGGDSLILSKMLQFAITGASLLLFLVDLEVEAV